jgi:hypothetical protein
LNKLQYCIGHKELRAVSLPPKSRRNEEMKTQVLRMNVMYNMSVNVHINVCYASIIIRYSLYIGEKHSEGKDVGEI